MGFVSNIGFLWGAICVVFCLGLRFLGFKKFRV